jgi:uncharacterized membrane protein (UPF0127 family)
MKIWRPRSSAFIIGGVVVIILASTVLFAINHFHALTTVNIGSGVYQLRLATTPDAREKGLSGTASLNPDGGLLMAFPSSDTWGIWMKDMKVPIDIVWLNEDKKVVYIVKNASPSDSTDKTFKPIEAARYVLELPAGSVDQSAIKANISAVFTLDATEVK